MTKKVDNITKALLVLCFLLISFLIGLFFTYKESYKFYNTTGQIKSFHQRYIKNYPTDTWVVKIIEDKTGKEINSAIIRECNKKAVLANTSIYVRETTSTYFYMFKLKTYYIVDGDFCMPEQKTRLVETK